MAIPFLSNGKEIPPSLKVLFIVVNREKGDAYLNMLQDFEINAQLTILASGSANEEALRKLGMATPKMMIVATVREDKAPQVLEYLQDRFKTIKNGKGIAFTVPMSAIIGVSMYQFLSNQPSEA